MLVFPNCKINLGLQITGKRADGYHNLETVFYPVQLNDALEIITASENQSLSTINFTHSGFVIAGEENDNLCARAYHLLKKDFPQLPAVKIHLHKAIPMGAGLGGGSADAAFTLTALNEKFALNLSPGKLLDYALALGSDCPFFIINTPCVATGRGEIMEPIELSLAGYHLVIVNPGIHVNTGWAFSRLNISNETTAKKNSLANRLQSIVMQPVDAWKAHLVNDFEAPVFEQYPEIKHIKESFYKAGAFFASMSGSGSSVYGIFQHPVNTALLNFPGNYFIHNILL